MRDQKLDELSPKEVEIGAIVLAISGCRTLWNPYVGTEKIGLSTSLKPQTFGFLLQFIKTLLI